MKLIKKFKANILCILLIFVFISGIISGYYYIINTFNIEESDKLCLNINGVSYCKDFKITVNSTNIIITELSLPQINA